MHIHNTHIHIMYIHSKNESLIVPESSFSKIKKMQQCDNVAAIA